MTIGPSGCNFFQVILKEHEESRASSGFSTNLTAMTRLLTTQERAATFPPLLEGRTRETVFFIRSIYREPRSRGIFEDIKGRWDCADPVNFFA
jgi:hypothetical protein